MYHANPFRGLTWGELLLTTGLTAVGVIGIIMGARTVKASPPMPPPTI